MRRLVTLVADVLLLPLVAGLNAGLFEYAGCGELLALVPGRVGLAVRSRWYARTLAGCGEDVSVAFGAIIHRRETVVGDRFHLGAYSLLGLADIGDDVMTGSHVAIISGVNQYDISRSPIPMHKRYQGADRITIGDDVAVCSCATVAANVPAHGIVAAGAVHTRDAEEEYVILVGVPARGNTFRR